MAENKFDIQYWHEYNIIKVLKNISLYTYL